MFWYAVMCVSCFVGLAVLRGNFKGPFLPATIFCLIMAADILSHPGPMKPKAMFLGVTWLYAAFTHLVLGHLERNIILSLVFTGIMTCGLLVMNGARWNRDAGPWAQNIGSFLTHGGWTTLDTLCQIHTPGNWKISANFRQADLESVRGAGHATFKLREVVVNQGQDLGLAVRREVERQARQHGVHANGEAYEVVEGNELIGAKAGYTRDGAFVVAYTATGTSEERADRRREIMDILDGIRN